MNESENQTGFANQVFLNRNGLSRTCFLNKLLKCVGFLKFKAYAISETFHLLCFKRILDSLRRQPAMSWVVVFPVTTFTARFK